LNDKVEVFHGIWHAGVVTSVDSNVQVKTMIRRIYRGVGGGTFDQETSMLIHNNQLTEFIRKPVLYSLCEKVELYDNKSWVGGSIVAKKKDEMTVKFDIQTDPENIVGAYLNPTAIRNLVRKIDTHSKGSLRNKSIPQGPDFEGLRMLKTHITTIEGLRMLKTHITTIPFDMNDAEAYPTSDFSLEISAMDLAL